MREQRFKLGALVSTPGALKILGEAGVSPASLLERHMGGDWGEVSPADARENEYSVKHGFRIVSSYPLPAGERVWIITERDRSVTTLLLPEEY